MYLSPGPIYHAAPLRWRGSIQVLGGTVVPDPEMGESVAAFVQPAPGAVPGPELEQEIIAFVKSKTAGFKAPRTVRFVGDLPRSETGKLMKVELRARYAGG